MGFVHAFRPLGADETRHSLACQWPQLGGINPDGDFTDAEAIAAIIRNTGGNLRLLHRHQAGGESSLPQLSILRRRNADFSLESLAKGYF